MSQDRGRVQLIADAAARDNLTTRSTCLVDLDFPANRAALEAVGFKLIEPDEGNGEQVDMGGPAFPHGSPEQGGHPGEVTLWDWYAREAFGNYAGQYPPEDAARFARRDADAMMVERESKTKGES